MFLEVVQEYKTKLFGIYWGRWMLSAIVMMPFMLLFETFAIPLWLNLLFSLKLINGSLVIKKLM